MQLQPLAALAVALGVLLRLLDQPFDLALGQTRRRCHADALALAGTQILGRHVHHPVTIDGEGDLDLRDAPRCRRDPQQLEAAQRRIVGRQLPLPLQDVHPHDVLVVLGGGEGLALVGRDRRVPVDDPGEHTALGLHAERQRSHVQQQNVFQLAAQHAGLDGRAHRYDLVWIDGLVGLLAEDLLDLGLDPGHARHASYEDDIVESRHRDSRVLECHRARRPQATDQLGHQLFQLLATQRQHQVLGTGIVRADEGQVDVRLFRGGQLVLGALRRLLESLERHRVAAQVDPLVFLEPRGEMLDQRVVEVLTTEEGVSVGALDFEDAVADFEDRDIEGTAAQIEDCDRLALVGTDSIGERRRSGLVDDPQHLEAGDLARLFRGLALRVVEVGRDRDHGLLDGLADVVRRGVLEPREDLAREFLGRALSVVDLYPGVTVVTLDDREGCDLGETDRLVGVVLPADQTLTGEDGARRIGDRLALGDLPDELLTGLGKGDDRGSGARAFGVRDHLGDAFGQDGDARVRGPEIDSDHPAHSPPPSTSGRVTTRLLFRLPVAARAGDVA